MSKQARPSVPEDQLESRAAMENRLGLAAKTRKAAFGYAAPWMHDSTRELIRRGFLKGVAWERRRRRREGC